LFSLSLRSTRGKVGTLANSLIDLKRYGEATVASYEVKADCIPGTSVLSRSSASLIHDDLRVVVVER